MQSKNYKSGGWVCVVLSLVRAPLPDEADGEASLCDDDEGDPAGVSVLDCATNRPSLV
jgi:hypothetical protein